MEKQRPNATRGRTPPAALGPDRLLAHYEQELQASEARCRTLIGKNADGVLVVRRSGAICFVNPAAEALLGRRAADLVGEMFGVPLTPGEATEVDIPRGLGQGGVAEMRVTEITWEGEPAYLASLRDVTERKRTGEALRFLARAGTLLAGSLDSATALATTGRLAVQHLADWCLIDLLEDGQVHRALALGRDAAPGSDPPRALAGRYPLDGRAEAGPAAVLASGKAEVHNQIGAALLDGLALAPGHREVFRALGATAALVVPLVARGRTLGAITFLTGALGRGSYGPPDLALAEDLTRRAALALDNARLYDEAQEAVRRRDEFLALLGHELRNPLAAIHSAAQLLAPAAARDPALGPTQQVIRRQSQHMSRLLDDLLDLSRVTRGKIELRKQAVELAVVVADAVAASRALLEGRRHRLTVSLPPEPVALEADPTRLGQVFANLLNNAAKYTDPGGRISLTARREGGEVVVRVRDSGVGIPPDMLGRIFEPFVQLGRSRGRSQGGLGMGLTLVRALLDMHGGRVTAHSEGPGCGSEFVLRLPVGGPCVRGAGGPPADAAAPEPTGRCRIVLVEDNADNRSMFRALLEMWGHPVEEAADGPAGLEKVGACDPEVAIVDIDLPGLSGYDLARAVRRTRPDRRPFLVALTGYGQPDDRRRALEAGFDAHLVKPVDLKELERVLDRVPARSAP
jgi:signal transduction histidine kinase/ActR/RegA family two-component response regulator